MHDFEVFRETGKLITSANRFILGNRLNTGVEDAREYLTRLNSAQRVLMRSTDAEIATGAGESVAYGDLALGEWPVNRSRALLFLLTSVGNSASHNKWDTAEASVECAAALVEEPLIPDLNRTTYQTTVASAILMLQSAAEKLLPIHLVYTTYWSGVVYNAERFIPDIFPENITPLVLRRDRELFLEHLDILQSTPREIN